MRPVEVNLAEYVPAGPVRLAVTRSEPVVRVVVGPLTVSCRSPTPLAVNVS
jgi:hypothetical protein